MQLCEKASKTIVPTIRYYLAKELLEKYGFTQVEVAKILGVTQPAISQYLKLKRAKKLVKLSEEVIEKIKNLAISVKLKGGEVNLEEEICKICKLIRGLDEKRNENIKES